jgi:DNA repair exonuclease SbcCD ATPase subunit
MQQININELKPHPRNNEFFDDMTGDAWNAFKESISTSGIVEPIVVTQDMIIVSGHQRVRAAKELGLSTIMVDIRKYENDDKVLKDLIETNIRQRGIGNPNPVKLGRCIKELERIYGIEHGGDRKTSSPKVSDLNQSDIAEMIGISVDTLNNYKKLTELIPELEDLVDTGILAPTTALALVKYMSPSEQEEFIRSMDITKKITKGQVQQYIDKIKQLENDNPKVKELETQISELKTEKNILERKVKLNQEESDKYNKLKSDIEFLTKQKTDLGRQIDSATELAGLTVRLQKLLEIELAPIKFKRCMEELDSSDVCVGNLTDIISKIDDWSDEMKKLLNNNIDYVVDVQ